MTTYVTATERRLDRGMYTIPIWWGLVFSGIYTLAQPQVITTIPDGVENLLGGQLLASAVLCLTGTQIPDTAIAYRLEIVGLLGIITVLAVLAVSTELTLLDQFTMHGSFGAIIQLGSLRMAFRLGLALKHQS